MKRYMGFPASEVLGAIALNKHLRKCSGKNQNEKTFVIPSDYNRRHEQSSLSLNDSSNWTFKDTSYVWGKYSKNKQRFEF